ncbi:MAG TPA: hypothetical protein VL251_08615 [Thermomonas sp.]|nr:hypothetical protein [Thermomonas sp.]
MPERHDSFIALRDRMRWRFATIMCWTGLAALALLGVANFRGGRSDSVVLSIVVGAILAACLAMLYTLPKPLGGRIYHWLAVAILVFLPWFGWHEGRTFHYWMYVLPPVLFFLMRPYPALAGMVAFGIYACALLLPFTAPVDIARIGASYLLLVGFLFTYARFEERAGAMLRYHSDHDALTNCFNRRIFNERLQQLEQSPGDGCASCCSTSTASRRSTTSTATWSATASSPRWRRRSAASCRPTPRCSATAARSSRSSWRAPAPARAPSSPSACAPRCRPPRRPTCR